MLYVVAVIGIYMFATIFRNRSITAVRTDGDVCYFLEQRLDTSPVMKKAFLSHEMLLMP